MPDMIRVKIPAYVDLDVACAELVEAASQGAGKPTFAANIIFDAQGAALVDIGVENNPSAADMTNAINKVTNNPSSIVTAISTRDFWDEDFEDETEDVKITNLDPDGAILTTNPTSHQLSEWQGSSNAQALVGSRSLRLTDVDPATAPTSRSMQGNYIGNIIGVTGFKMAAGSIESKFHVGADGELGSIENFWFQTHSVGQAGFFNPELSHLDTSGVSSTNYLLRWGAPAVDTGIAITAPIDFKTVLNLDGSAEVFLNGSSFLAKDFGQGVFDLTAMRVDAGQSARGAMGSKVMNSLLMDTVKLAITRLR